CGATSGDAPSAELTWVFFLQLRVIGSTMGTKPELEALTRMLAATGLRPGIDRVLSLDRAEEGFRAMAEGDLFGKVVFTACPGPPPARAGRPSPHQGDLTAGEHGFHLVGGEVVAQLIALVRAALECGQRTSGGQRITDAVQDQDGAA